MNPEYESTMMSLMYVTKFTQRGQAEPSGANNAQPQISVRRWAAIHCGRVAVRVGQWLLQDETNFAPHPAIPYRQQE